ncbi:RNA polymerase sigma factor [Paenibacillus massiliensis]|uniref:RNA polymerase sigma factor n=1 Tax=Paenibacillus massiliensis TaxID=225917 RepID=UPI00037089C7|nr:sigma-70 family RNA polymerase sigma factor [Paenibacillus massiliensis]
MIVLSIFARARMEDQLFMTELYQQYYPFMRKKAQSFVKDVYIVEDLIHDGFMKLLPKASILRSLDVSRRTSYISHTIKSVCVDFIRRHIRDKQRNIAGMENMAEQLAASEATPEESCVDKESYEELGRALEELSARDQQLLAYKYQLELKDQEMAQLMNIPSRNIQTYLTRARRRLLYKVCCERERTSIQHPVTSASKKSSNNG